MAREVDDYMLPVQSQYNHFYNDYASSFFAVIFH